MLHHIALQISPESKSAYFADYIKVAQQELEAVAKVDAISVVRVGALEFFYLHCELDLLPKLVTLSFVQGIYKVSKFGGARMYTQFS